jgi:dephospho-CoA kinase
MEIYAVTGTNGSGKGTFVRFLEEFGFEHFSARNLILEEIERQGLENTRAGMNIAGNSLRREHGPEYVARELLRRAQASGSNKVVIESVRCLGEVHFLKKHGTVLLAVDDPIVQRYNRITARAHSTDFVTFDQFVEQERLESIGTEEWDMNIPACVAEADYTFSENGDIGQFRQKVHAWLQEQGDRMLNTE